MASWDVTDELSTEVTDVHRVEVRGVAGEISITRGEGTLKVRRISGDTVDVRIDDGTLRITQPKRPVSGLDRLFSFFDGRRQRFAVEVALPDAEHVEVSCVSADVVVSGVAEHTSVKTVSGEVTLSALRGRVDIKTVSGDVEAKGVAATVKFKTVSGDLSLIDGECTEVDAKAVSGDVLLDLELRPDGDYDVTTVSGDVAVRTQAEPDLSVQAATVSGRMRSDFDLDWDGEGRGRRNLHATLGAGGARLSIKTVSGDMRVFSGRQAAA